jgi:hypothetical protein
MFNLHYLPLFLYQFLILNLAEHSSTIYLYSRTQGKVEKEFIIVALNYVQSIVVPTDGVDLMDNVEVLPVLWQ